MSNDNPGVDGTTGTAEPEGKVAPPTPEDNGHNYEPFEKVILSHWGRKNENGEMELICNACNESIDVANGNWELADSVFWHASCFYESVHGFIPLSGDGWTHNRDVKTEIGGETFEWVEWLDVENKARKATAFPMWDDLNPRQREQLKEMAKDAENMGANGPTFVSNLGKFPARYALLGAFKPPTVDYHNEHAFWICPTCGHIVGGNKRNEGLDLNETCDHCDSNAWVTHGVPIELQEVAGLEQLSEREGQVVAFDQLGYSDQAIAGRLNVKPSSVREYRKRAKAKARDAKQLYAAMDRMMDVNEGPVIE